MSGNNKGKKPKIFVKKRPDKIDAVHDEFYEYDNLKSKNNTLDESFFEDFKSVDFDQMNYDKEHVPSEDIGDEDVPSADIIEDEVIQEIPEKTVDAGENTDKIVEDKTDKIVEDVSTSEQFDSDDDDFGSLESENEDFILKEEPKAVLSDEKSKDEAIAFEDKDEKDSIFDQYGISNDEELAKEENYDSLFEKDESFIRAFSFSSFFISFKTNENRNWMRSNCGSFCYSSTPCSFLRRSLIKSFTEIRTTATRIIAIPTKSIAKKCSFMIRKAKNTAEIGSTAAIRLLFTGPI
mgnify:CR=1 FL=1